jgi:putative ABC transport system permease protein
MINTQMVHAWRQVWLNKGRSLLIVISIAVSTCTLGLILVSFALLEREMNTLFLKASPHAISYRLASFDDQLISRLKQLPGIANVEARRTISGHIKRRQGNWKPLRLFVLRDYADISLDIVEPVEGSWPPIENEILIEQQALSVLGAKQGDQIIVKTASGVTADFPINGLVHDIVLPQAEMENIVYGYISRESLALIGEQAGFNELNITLATDDNTNSHLRERASEIESWLRQQDIEVKATSIPLSGKHPHHAITDSMFTIQKVFGYLCAVFSGVLVFNLLSASLSRERSQIGVMKALGASPVQISSIYYRSVIFMGVAGLALGIPLANVSGAAYADLLSPMMNFTISSYAVPLWIYLVLLCVGLGIPLLAAAIPIWQASRAPIRESLVEYGIQQEQFGTGLLDRLLSLPLFSRPFRLTLRNTIRKKVRLLLTIMVLAIGVALFMAAFNLKATLQSQVEDERHAKGWDIALYFNQSYPMTDLHRAKQNLISAMPEVQRIEPFKLLQSTVLNAQEENALSLPVMILAPESKMIKFPLIQGRWLGAQEDDIVVNQAVLEKLPWLRVGKTITLNLDGINRTYRICGALKMLGSQMAFLQKSKPATAPVQSNTANAFFINSANSERQFLRELKFRIDDQLQRQGYEIPRITTSWEGLKSVEDHFEIIFNLTMILTVIIIIIGCNGIILTMTTNIMERTREIGVIKAIGSSRYTLFSMIFAEGLIIGLLSWMVGVILTFPLSAYIGYTLGSILINVPLPLVLEPHAFFTSLLSVLIVTSLACFIPAYRTATKPIYEVLLYE